jgi:ubiquinone/menaquinone biosynthesis C-methylase UbiE
VLPRSGAIGNNAACPIENKRGEICVLKLRIGCIVLAQLHIEQIHRYYNNPAIAASYGRQEYITPCERLLFSAYISPGAAILDIGVGGGRTSQYLAGNASRYVGIDYAPEMVRICREKYPQWEYLEVSATDLSPFQGESFDVVVLSYNMLDDLIPDESRRRCLQECRRVLRTNGFLIFSSHNPRAIFVRPQRENTKSRLQDCRPGFSMDVFALFRKVLHWSANSFMALRESLRRVFSYGRKLPFWRGEGYMLDNQNLMTHFAIPKKIIAELVQYGFRFIALQGDDYPKRSHLLVTEWYYYVFAK